MLHDEKVLKKALELTRKNVPKSVGENMRKRHLQAIRKASKFLYENPYIYYEEGSLLILSNSMTDAGEAKFYKTNDKECRLIEPKNILCHAFWEGYPCWHRAAFEIVKNYFLILEQEDDLEKKLFTKCTNCRRCKHLKSEKVTKRRSKFR